jgi:hypothetical protein
VKEAWPTLRDFVITGTGLVIVWSQLLLWALRDRDPSDVLLAVGLGLVMPSASAHVRTVLTRPEAGSSSHSSPPQLSPQPLPSPPPDGTHGEQAAP